MKLLTIRLPDELHKSLKLRCVEDETDMSEVVRKLIEEHLRKTERPKKRR